MLEGQNSSHHVTVEGGRKEMAIRIGLAAATLLLLLACGVARADATATVPAGETAIVDLTGNVNDADVSAVILRNKAARSCVVRIDRARATGGRTIGGYGYLDRSMTVRVSGLRARQYRAMVRVPYREDALRARGIRAGTQRLMRRCNGVWTPARACIRETGARKVRWTDARAPAREKIAVGREKGRVGNYGYYGGGGGGAYVWAVIDVDGEYAVGGMIPEPATAACLVAGLAGLGWIRRRRR